MTKINWLLLLLALTGCGHEPGPQWMVLQAPPACPVKVVTDAWLEGCLTFATTSTQIAKCIKQSEGAALP